MSQNTTQDKKHIISDLTRINAVSDTVQHDVSLTANHNILSRFPLARAAVEKESTGNNTFPSKLSFVRHTDDGDINSCSDTNMTNTNPSDVSSLTCGTSNEARGSLITTALREIIFRLRQRSERFTKGWRKGPKAPPRSHYKFYKPEHLWSLRIYREATSTIRPVPYRQASSAINRKSDNGLYANLFLRGELYKLMEDPF